MDAIDALVDNHALFTEEFAVPSEQATLRNVPEIALLGSILERGILDLFAQSKVDPGTAAKIRRDAKKWMMANDPEDIFSFVSICDVFHFDILNLRNYLLSKINRGEIITIEVSDE